MIAPAISRQLMEDMHDPVGPPCVVQFSEETGQLVKVITEADDDYDTEVELAEREKGERKDSVRKARVESAYARELLAEASAAAAVKERPQGTPASRFMPVVPDLKTTPPGWIVKGVMPKKALAAIYGRWGSGKSSVAIELGVDIALGRSWHGRKVQQGRVIYVASENAHGVRARLDALLRDRGIALDDLGGRFLEITGRPHLLKPEEVTELIKELKPWGPTLVIVDTLARAMAAGDENSATEMGIAVENCQSIMNATGATVMLVHHTGKNEALGMRGSSALPAACDTEIIIERPDDDVNFRTVKLGKQRDAQDYCNLFSFELKVVELGADEDGDKITSTVVHEIAPAPEGLNIPSLPDSPTRCAIRDVLGDAQRAMSFEEMIEAAIPRLAPPDPGTKDRRRTRIRQTAERMLKDRELHVSADGMVSRIDPTMPFTPVPTVTASVADPHADLTAGGVA